MGILDRLLGREQPRNDDEQRRPAPQYPPYPANGPQPYGAQPYGAQPAPQPPQSVAGQQPVGQQQSAISPEDQQALERYRYMLRTAPPETIEQAHEEAFAQLTPQQRALALQQLVNAAPPHEQPSLAQAPDDPQTLARLATRAELRQPGALERIFGAVGHGGSSAYTGYGGYGGSMGLGNGGFGGMGSGMGMGAMLGGSLLSSIVGSLIGTSIADAFFDHAARNDPSFFGYGGGPFSYGGGPFGYGGGMPFGYDTGTPFGYDTGTPFGDMNSGVMTPDLSGQPMSDPNMVNDPGIDPGVMNDLGGGDPGGMDTGNGATDFGGDMGNDAGGATF